MHIIKGLLGVLICNGMEEVGFLVDRQIAARVLDPGHIGSARELILGVDRHLNLQYRAVQDSDKSQVHRLEIKHYPQIVSLTL